MKRRLPRLLDAFSAIAVLWVALAVIPVEALWYRPGVPVVEDTTTDRVPNVAFQREIVRDTRMQYQVVIRQVGSLAPLCDPRGGPFTYRQHTQISESVDLDWWTGKDRRCWPREPGTYLMETCWTVTQPFFGLVPPKTTCRQSPPFRVSEPMR